MDVQQFERLLMRYERLAGLAPRLKRLEQEHLDTLQILDRAQAANRRHERDMAAAEAKIEEWKVYSAQIALLVSPRREKEMPPMRPTRLELEIPF